MQPNWDQFPQKSLIPVYTLRKIVEFSIKRPIPPPPTPDGKKLQDVLQERDGTSLNYFEVISSYIEQFSQSILLYLI